MRVSSSLVSQIKNGKEYKEEQTDGEVTESLLGKVSRKDMKTLRGMAEYFVNQ